MYTPIENVLISQARDYTTRNTLAWHHFRWITERRPRAADENVESHPVGDVDGLAVLAINNVGSAHQYQQPGTKPR